MRSANPSYNATIIDAGVGNLGNLARALGHLGARAEVTADPDTVAAASCLLLPGVGAFKPPRDNLRGPVQDALTVALELGAWLLGICVGYQLLFESSNEFGEVDGLGLLPGRIERLPHDVSLPHIGWNRLRPSRRPAGASSHPLLHGIRDGSYVYFVHSYAPVGVPADVCLARTLHGVSFTAVAGRGQVLGTQFHPEKSGRTGLSLLHNYLRLAHGEEPCS